MNDLCCWAPVFKSHKGKTGTKAEDQFNIIAELNVDQCTYYFIRFATDAAVSLMALGNDDGDVYVWDLNTDDPTEIPVKIMTHPKRDGIVARDVSFSRNGTDLVICCDDGSIWHYQRGKRNNK